MIVTVNGLALVCALCPVLADGDVPASLVTAVAGLQDAERSNDAPDIDARAVDELKKMITELERYDKVAFKTRTTQEAPDDLSKQKVPRDLQESWFNGPECFDARMLNEIKEG